MTIRSCRVTVTDMDRVDHTVEVTAKTLYEAVALGLKAIRGDAWVNGIPAGFNVVRVKVCDVSIEHKVKLEDFAKWLDRKGSSPKEITDRNRIREILGIAKSVGK